MCWEEVVPGITVVINQKIPQIINGFESSCRQEPHNTLKPVKLLSSFRFSAKTALVGLGSQLRLLPSDGILLATHSNKIA